MKLDLFLVQVFFIRLFSSPPPSLFLSLCSIHPLSPRRTLALVVSRPFPRILYTIYFAYMDVLMVCWNDEISSFLSNGWGVCGVFSSSKYFSYVKCWYVLLLYFAQSHFSTVSFFHRFFTFGSESIALLLRHPIVTLSFIQLNSLIFFLQFFFCFWRGRDI